MKKENLVFNESKDAIGIMEIHIPNYPDYLSKKVKRLLYGIFISLSLHIFLNTSYPILPISALFLIMLMLVLMVWIPHLIRYPFYSVPKGENVSFFYNIIIYLMLFVIFLCSFMVIVYEVTGWYVDVSKYYNILDIYPHIWDYSGANVSQEPYGLANTVNIILYYSGQVIIPLWLMTLFIAFIRAFGDLRKMVREADTATIQEMRMLVNNLNNHFGDMNRVWNRIKIFLFSLGGLLMVMMMSLSVDNTSFQEGFSPWMGTIDISRGAYYILFTVANHFVGIVLAPILLLSGIYWNLLIYHYFKYFKKGLA